MYLLVQHSRKWLALRTAGQAVRLSSDLKQSRFPRTLERPTVSCMKRNFMEGDSLYDGAPDRPSGRGETVLPGALIVESSLMPLVRPGGDRHLPRSSAVQTLGGEPC